MSISSETNVYFISETSWKKSRKTLCSDFRRNFKIELNNMSTADLEDIKLFLDLEPLS
jgi:hypothetical protein